jgi:hypothetical protein
MLLAMLPGLVVLSSAAAAGEDPSIVGEWTTPFDIGLVAIHSVLLPSGKVLLFEKPGTGGGGSRAAIWDPVTGFLSGPPPSATWETVDVSDPLDLFCAAQSMTSDGRVVVVGGHKYGADVEYGIPETTVFDPTSSGWSNGPVLPEPRWYATTIELGNGKILIFSGISSPGVRITPVDSFDPANNTLSRLPASANLSLALYPRMFVLPNGKLIKTGPEAATRLFDPGTATWSSLTTMSGPDRTGGMDVLLPGLEKILVAGGGSPGLATAQILDSSAATPAWRSTGSMSFARRWGNAVMLADGTVLAVGGGADSTYTGPVFTSERFDPVTETWTTMASQNAPRMYHSTALLLPDARVLSAGQTNGTMQRTAEIYSPPYLFHGPRPTISSAPSSVGYGASFQIDTSDAADIARVALVRPGSVTHSNSFDQRYVDLSFTTGSGALNATAPANGNEAPPGWYMLFILNSSGVPSVASWVHVGGSLGPPTNVAPSVNAGADLSVVRPNAAALSGSVTDDGLPDPPGTTTHSWSKVSGPGTVTFGDTSALATSASFSSAGTYVLRLTGDDSALTASDDLTVTVADVPPPPTNAPPSVSAGADQAVVLPNSAGLSGSVTDDGLPNPPGVTTHNWSKVSGPGTVTFGDPAALATSAAFSTTGTYVLRLSADDSALAGSDDLTVTVTSGSGSSTLDVPVAVGSDDAEEKVSTGATPIGSTDLQLTMAGSVQQVVGMRFAGVSIPRGAVITKAYVQFEVDAVSKAAASLMVHGQAADSPPTFKNVLRNISSRPRTLASVGWTPAPWPTIQVHGPDQRTPDLSTIVQEIVNRPGWASGNAIVIIVTGTGKRVAESRNGTYAPVLHLEFR